MHSTLRIKPHLTCLRTDEGRVFLIGEQERYMLTGRTTELVLPLLDGSRTESDVVEALAGRATAAEVQYALSLLEDAGYVTDSPAESAVEEEALWYSFGLGAAAHARMAEVGVGVDCVGDGTRFRDAATAALLAAGLGVDDRATVRLVVTDSYLHPALASFNRRAAESGLSWMLVKPWARSPWIGPVFRTPKHCAPKDPNDPSATESPPGPCWECLAYRLRLNRPVETYVQRRLGRSEPVSAPVVRMASLENAAICFAASSLAHWIASGLTGALDETLYRLDLAPPAITEHKVVRRPQCAACGDPELVKKLILAPVVLQSTKKSFTEDGGHRCITPEETFSQHKHQVSPITGIVASVGPLPGRDHHLGPVYGTVRMHTPRSDCPVFGDFTRPSLGKGRTPAQAQAGALCEAIERASAVFQGDEPLVRARLDELGEDAFDPRYLQNFSQAQYTDRAELNERMQGTRRPIPAPYDGAKAIDWVPAWSLTYQRRRYLPAAYCYDNLPTDGEEPCCLLDGNGHAAGNCVEEAILQGVLELVERDAVGIWWYNQLRRPALALSSFRAPYFDSLMEHYAGLGHDLWVLDLTTDLRIPSFVALARCRESGRFSIGFGAHFEPRLGVQRALTELNQTFDPTGPLPAPLAALQETRFQFPDDTQPPRTRDMFEYVQRDDVCDDISAFVRTAQSLGLETLVQNQSRPDMGICAVKVVVPGLRHMWRRLGPGRLYDIPVKMGWIRAALQEADMNPVPLHL